MIFLQDDDSKQQFMVDTGAVCSVLPHRSNAQPAGPQLSGADGRSIPMWGIIRRCLLFGLPTFFVTFFLAAVYRPILCLDFLSAHRLLVDPVGRQVLDLKTLKPLSKTPTAAGTLRSKFAAALCSITPSVRSLLASFPAIVGDGKGKPSSKHKIRHNIETTGRPVFARRLDPDKLRKAEAEFRELEAAGIIRRSDSPWSSPLHMIRKKDGSWRPCGDYRRLNLATTHDRYPLPSILDLSNKLHGCKFFSCIYLVKGYHQILMAAQDIAKTGDGTDKVSTLRLKAARTPADTEPAKPPRRGRPHAQAPPVRAPPPKKRGRPCQVTFSLPPTTPPTTTSAPSASGRPLRTARPPNRLNL
jgi:hypothetical protein